MLYLFNSAFRPNYSANILNNFFLETGCVNEYRYRRANVDAQIGETKLRLDAKEALFIYIDRFHPAGFYYHPVRLLSYLEHELRGDQVYFRCKVEDFLYPQDLDKFQESLSSAFGGKGLPRLPALGPDSVADGYFALLGQNVIADFSCKHKDEAWVQSVENVAKTRVFARANVPFLRASIRAADKQKSYIHPKLTKNTAYYPLRRRKQYTFQLYYRYPIQDINHDAATRFSIDTPALVSVLGSSEITINSRNSTEYLNFSVKTFPEEKHGVLSLGPGTAPDNAVPQEPVLLPNATIAVRIKESLLFWPFSILLLFVYAILGLGTGTDFDKLLAPLQAAKQLTSLQGAEKVLLAFCQNYWLLVKAGASFFQALVILLLFRMLGKKIS